MPRLLNYNGGDLILRDDLRRLEILFKLIRHSLNLKYFLLNLSYSYNIKKDILDKVWNMLMTKLSKKSLIL